MAAFKHVPSFRYMYLNSTNINKKFVFLVDFAKSRDRHRNWSATSKSIDQDVLACCALSMNVEHGHMRSVKGVNTTHIQVASQYR